MVHIGFSYAQVTKGFCITPVRDVCGAWTRDKRKVLGVVIATYVVIRGLMG